MAWPDESIWDPVDSGLEPGWTYKKNKRSQNLADLANWPSDLVRAGQKSNYNILTIFFNQNDVILIYKKN